MKEPGRTHVDMGNRSPMHMTEDEFWIAAVLSALAIVAFVILW
jgi:hypothetical protein